MGFCVVSLLLRISGSRLYLHRSNEALLICWSVHDLTKGLLVRWNFFLNDYDVTDSQISLWLKPFLSWIHVDEALLSPSCPNLFCQKLDLSPLFPYSPVTGIRNIHNDFAAIGCQMTESCRYLTPSWPLRVRSFVKNAGPQLDLICSSAFHPLEAWSAGLFLVSMCCHCLVSLLDLIICTLLATILRNLLASLFM